MPGSSSLIEAKNDSAQGVVPALAGAAMGQGYLAVGSEAGELGGGVLPRFSRCGRSRLALGRGRRQR